MWIISFHLIFFSVHCIFCIVCVTKNAVAFKWANDPFAFSQLKCNSEIEWAWCHTVWLTYKEPKVNSCNYIGISKYFHVKIKKNTQVSSPFQLAQGKYETKEKHTYVLQKLRKNLYFNNKIFFCSNGMHAKICEMCVCVLKTWNGAWLKWNATWRW